MRALEKRLIDSDAKLDIRARLSAHGIPSRVEIKEYPALGATIVVWVESDTDAPRVTEIVKSMKCYDQYQSVKVFTK